MKTDARIYAGMRHEPLRIRAEFRGLEPREVVAIVAAVLAFRPPEWQIYQVRVRDGSGWNVVGMRTRARIRTRVLALQHPGHGWDGDDHSARK